MRLLALPLLRLGALVAAMIFGAALVSGVFRALPWLLSSSVPASLSPVLLRGLVEMGLEVALFAAPPIAAALVAARLVERGEARALAALGVSPARLARTGSAALAAFALASAAASAAWGVDASAPGRAAASLIRSARAACEASATPVAVDVPFAQVAWICFAGEPPLAVGRIEGAAFSARDVIVSDDLRALSASDATLVLEGEGEAAHLHAGEARIRGLVPLGHASNLAPLERATLLALTSWMLSAVALVAVLERRIGGRLRATLVGVAGPVAALLAFSSLERAPEPLAAYAAVPVAGLAAIAISLSARAIRRGRG